MTTVTFQGNPVTTIGNLPPIGNQAPDFTLIKNDLSKIHLKTLKDKKIILNIFPSLDTPICGKSVKTFNAQIKNIPDVTVICISADLPFAARRFCETEHTQNIIHASTYANPNFGKDYGVLITSSPLKDLMSRAVIVLDENKKIIYTEQVSEITNEPNYGAALEAATKT